MVLDACYCLKFGIYMLYIRHAPSLLALTNGFAVSQAVRINIPDTTPRSVEKIR